MVTPPQCWSSSTTRASRPSRSAVARSFVTARACARNSSAISAPGRPFGAHGVLARFGGKGLEAREELLDLHQVVGERLGRRVDRRETAADHHHGQAQLHVGDRVRLGRAGQLQRHEEVGGGAYSAREAVGDVEHGRLAGAHGERDVVEAKLHRILQRDRAAEAHPAVHREVGAALEEQPHQLEEVLVQRTVMPYSATPPNPAMTRSSSDSYSVRTSRIGSNATRAPSCATPENCSGAARSSARRCRRRHDRRS